MQFCRRIRLKSVKILRFGGTKNSINSFSLQSSSTPLLFSRYNCSTIMSPHCKEFAFGDYDIIGFDLDGTLLRYNLETMVPLVYDLLRQFLVEKKSYPRSLLDRTLDKDFLQKGLMIDTENGNILKLGSDATIIRATHGTTLLSSEQIIQTYGVERKWSVSTQFFNDPLSTWNGPQAEKLHTLLDYFDLAASLVFGQAVDSIDAKSETRPLTYGVWSDVQKGLCEIYSRDNFSNGCSEYFNALRADPKRFLLRTNPKMIQWLRDLRVDGKALFLLTGSNIDFANFTASYSLGDNWQQLFDCVICYAKKPGFFTMERPFLRVANNKEIVGSDLSLSTTLSLNSVYSQGNWKQLRASLSANIGKRAEEMRSLYVGDNLIQDVYAPATQNGLCAVALCEEMFADEGFASYEYEFQNVIASPFWGSYFCVHNEPTLWAHIIAKHTQLCVPTVDTIAEMPLTHKFHCENGSFFPKAPSAL